MISCVGLGLGATWLVEGAANIAKRLGISELVIGLTIVAFGTSAPEFAVSISAALGGDPDISVANIVGSNIFNIGIILGGCATLMVVKTSKTLIRRDGALLLAVTTVLLAMLYDRILSRVEGIILFGVLVGYLVYLFVRREAITEDDVTGQHKRSWRDFPMLILGIVMIVCGGHFLRYGAKNIAEAIGISQWVIGVTVVAAGTSLPELAVSLVALIKKHHGISAGNLIGSNLFNTLGVLGLAGAITIKPLAVDPSALISMVGLLVLTIIVLIFMRTGWRLVRWEGVVLVVISLAIWMYNIIVVAK